MGLTVEGASMFDSGNWTLQIRYITPQSGSKVIKTTFEVEVVDITTEAALPVLVQVKLIEKSSPYLPPSLKAGLTLSLTCMALKWTLLWDARHSSGPRILPCFSFNTET